MKRGIWGVSLICLLIVAAFFMTNCETTLEGTGKGDISFIIPAGKGGATDKLTRFWIGINEAGHYTDRWINPVNKMGGAGAVAMYNVLEQSGNGNVVLAISNYFVTIPLYQNLPFTYRDFTPIALLANDNFVLWVHADSPWMTAQEFIEEAKKRSIEVGGTGSKQDDEIIFRGIEMAANTKPFKYVPYKGGGLTAKALVGKNLEATVNQVSEAYRYYPDIVRPLCVLQDESLDIEGLEDVPICREAGIPVSYQYMRGVFAPPGISEEARDELVELFRGISEDSEWKIFTEKAGMRAMFLTGDKLTDFLEDFEEVNKDILNSQGWIR